MVFRLQPLGPFKFEIKPYTLALGGIKIPEAKHQLLAWWKLDETEGAEASDASGNNHFGMLVGGPKWLPTGGKMDGALQFDGVDDYVQTSYTDDLPVWTISVWVKSPASPTSEGPSAVVNRENTYQINWDHQSEVFRGSAGVQVGGEWYAAGFGDLQPNTWYHLLVNYDGESLKAYKDGVLVTDTSGLFGSPYAEQATLTLGRHAYDREPENHFAGLIDDVRIYNYPLAETEVAALYSGKTSSPAQPTEVLAASEPEPEAGSRWILISIIIVLVISAAGLVMFRKKVAS